jgi:hypothetical protein
MAAGVTDRLWEMSDVVDLLEAFEASHRARLQGYLDLWQTGVEAENVLAAQCSFRPCERKVGIGLLLFFGFGLASPTYRFLGILPELFSL